MLTTSKHPRYSYLRRLMILPLLSVLCVLFAFKIKQDGNKAKETVPSLRSQTEEKQMQELDFKEQKHATTNMEVNMQQKDQKLVDNGEQEDVDKSFLEREQDTTRKSKHQQDSASSNRYKPAIVILDGEKMTHEEYEARKIDRSELYSILYTKYDKLGEEGKNGVLIAITKQKGVAADKLPSGEEWKKPLYYGADTKPFYPGGREALTKYIKSNLNYPEAAKKKKIEVRVTVAFVVETDGSINYFAPWTKWGYGFEEEAIRLIKNSGKWMPGTYKGKAVDCKVNMTIDFALDGPSVSAGF